MAKEIRKSDLLQFTSDNAAADTIDHVFRQDGYVVATDGHIMVRIPVGSVVDGEGIAEQDRPNVNRVIPEHFDKPRVLRVKAIEAALEKAPKVDAQRVCPECHGGGTVRWNYEGVEDYYEDEFRCPCCRGKGYVPTDGERMPDPRQVFTVLGIKYRTPGLEQLITALGVVGARQATILDKQYHRLYMEAGSSQILIAGIEEDGCGEVIKVI